jgi:hypothetical protein
MNERIVAKSGRFWGGAYIASPNSGAKLAGFVRPRAPNLIRLRLRPEK